MLGFDTFQRGNAVNAGHDDVRYHQIRALFFKQFEALSAVASRADSEAFSLEHFSQCRAYVLLIVYYKYSGHFIHSVE